MLSLLSPLSVVMTPSEARSVKRTLVCRGHLSALLLVLCAVLINHIRRVLVPSLGQFLWWHALETMKLARSSPHHLLVGKTLRFSWHEVCVWSMHNQAFRLLRSQSSRRTSENQQQMPAVVLFAAMSLALLEHAYVETCWAGAQLYALAQVFASDERRVLVDGVLGGPGWLRVVFVLGLLARWAWYSVPVLVMKGGVLLQMLVWGTTAHLVRYSNKYFILLELSDMLVTFGWMALGLITVVAWKLEDVWGRGRMEAGLTYSGRPRVMRQRVA